jgi:hypothetical protein
MCELTNGMAGERHGRGMLCVNPPLLYKGYLKSNKAVHTVRRVTFAGRILHASVSGHHFEIRLAHTLVHA